MIRGRMRELGVTFSLAARELLISECSFSLKMNGHHDFTLSEMRSLMDLLQIPYDRMGSVFIDNAGRPQRRKRKPI